VLPDEDPLNYMAKRPEQEVAAGVFVPSALIITIVVVPSVMLYREIKKRAQNEATRTQAGERMITSSCTTTLMVMVLYLISYLPIVFFNVFSLFYGDLNPDDLFYPIMSVQLSSLANPYLFIFRSSALRRAAISILPTKLAEGQREGKGNSSQETEL